MKEIFVNYFKSLGMGELILQRIELLITRANILFPNEDFTDVTVNEYVTKEGAREYTLLIFFSEKVSIGFSDFLHSDEAFLVGICQKFRALEIISENYDFIKATEKSRINIMGRYIIQDEMSTMYRGSGDNCDHIMQIFKKYVVTRLALP